MDTKRKTCYAGEHETLWDTAATRKTKASSYCFAEKGTQLSLRGHEAGVFFELRGPLVPGLPKEGPGGASIPADAGPAPRLTKAQKEKLLRLLVKGAPAEGYATDRWTLPRIARVIRKHFGVRYHPGHVWWLMKGLRWSCQK